MGLSTRLCMGDSAYSCNNFVQPLHKIDNVVTITRARRNKAMCAGHDVRAKGSSPLWAEIERSIS